MFVEFCVAVPLELNLDPTVLIAMDFAVALTCDHGMLIAEHAWLGRTQWRTEQHIPGRGQKGVAIALGETVRRVADHRLFQHLRLLALMLDFSQQPQVVPRRTRMFDDFQKMPTDQRRLITAAFGLAIVRAVALQSSLSQVFAIGAVNKMTRIIVVFQRRSLLASNRT